MSASDAACTASASSLTPHVLTCTPKRISASVLSPSVTATKRMLSPKRASFIERVAAQPLAARAHVPMDAVTAGLLAWPTTVLRGTAMRLRM